MKKKLIIVSLATIAFFASAGFKLNAMSAEDTAKEDEIVSVADTETEVDLGGATPGAEGLLQEGPALTQEEYDDLIRRLPEGAVLVGDIKVMPGVVKDPTKEKPYPD